MLAALPAGFRGALRVVGEISAGLLCAFATRLAGLFSSVAGMAAARVAAAVRMLTALPAGFGRAFAVVGEIAFVAGILTGHHGLLGSGTQERNAVKVIRFRILIFSVKMAILSLIVHPCSGITLLNGDAGCGCQSFTFNVS
jgi:hypothetical protein